MARLILFDIDMTLIRTSGAGRSAVNTVLSRLSGVEQATAGIRFDGRTDRGIFLEALETHGLVNGDPDAAFEAFVAHYLEELPRGATSARPRACPASSRTATTTARTYRNRTPSSPLRCWQMGNRSLGANLGFVPPDCTCYAPCNLKQRSPTMAVGDHTIDINGARVPFGLCSTIVGAFSVYQNARRGLRARDTLTWTFECGTCARPVVARRAFRGTDITWPDGHACAQLAAGEN